jgi:hypothetical protein
MMLAVRGYASASLVTVVRQIENSPKELEALQEFVPFAPCYSMGWKGLEAVRYRTDSASGTFPSILNGYRSHAETVSDFRKNLLNIRETVKDAGQNPVSLLRQHAGHRGCAA